MSYWANLVIAADMLANVVVGGDLGTTISARADEARFYGKPWGCILCRVLDWIQANHCADSLSNARLYAADIVDDIDAAIAARHL